MFKRSQFSVFSSQWILILAFLLSLPAVTTRIYASDEVEGFAWLHSLFFDRDVSFENEYEYFYQSGQVKNPGFHQTFLEDRFTERGLRPNFTTMGAAILWTPFYAGGHLAALAGAGPADGWSRPYVVAVAIGSAAYGFFALLLSLSIARRLTGHGLAASVAVWLGTPLLFYMYVTPVFTHACSAFAVALFLWTWLHTREHWGTTSVAALGLAGGLMTIVRAQDALFIIGPTIDFLMHASSVRRPGLQARRATADLKVRPTYSAQRLVPGLLAAAVGFLLAAGPQLLAFKALNGRFRQSEFETRKMSWMSPHGWQVLADQQHGLFFWTPLAVVALAGLVLLVARGKAGAPAGAARARDLRWIGLVSIVMIALQAYIAGAVESWTVAGAYGQRRFVSITPLIVLGLASLLAAAPIGGWKRRMTLAAIGLCVWWNLGLMAQFGLHTMDREKLTLADNARQSFIELPRTLPSLAWRYLTDRASFYNLPRQ